MSKKKKPKKTTELGQILIQGMEEALAYELGEKTDLKTTYVELPPEPKVFKAKEIIKTRKSLKLSQVRFAHYLGVSPSTVRSWEQNQKPPNKAACRLIEIIKVDPTVFGKIGKQAS